MQSHSATLMDLAHPDQAHLVEGIAQRPEEGSHRAESADVLPGFNRIWTAWIPPRAQAVKYVLMIPATACLSGVGPAGV